MTDRELLELAAKAAGMWKTDFSLNDDCLPDLHEEKGFRLAMGKGWWNPLEDDGDAFRLAADIGIEFFHAYTNDGRGIVARHQKIWDNEDDEDFCCFIEENVNDNIYAATRRAIVRAAAEIGKQMGDSND